MIGGTLPAERNISTDYGAKFLFLRSIRISVPLCLYSITAFMYYPVFQSFVYQKVCEQYGDKTLSCKDRKSTSSDPELQAKANWVLLLSSIAMCLLGAVSSAAVGRFGDTSSRKAALIIPFLGLILSDIALFMQSYFMEVSVYWAVGSEAIFAIFGGYMSIFSSCFAYASDSVSSYSSKICSQTIAILEGVIGLGGQKCSGFYLIIKTIINHKLCH
ncbi:unnamed protein product [Gongylonema pulchrum]|uniref:Proton-dependent oligopeptide transporter family n=1 Tax=Gongylonema pulchrum TaxID=637853 RepID=A0A183D380_9BILA|nr:unnamed protein product [Gongylonema pulchrum]